MNAKRLLIPEQAVETTDFAESTDKKEVRVPEPIRGIREIRGRSAGVLGGINPIGWLAATARGWRFGWTLCSLFLAGFAQAAPAASVDLVADLLDAFGSAQEIGRAHV